MKTHRLRHVREAITGATLQGLRLTQAFSVLAVLGFFWILATPGYGQAPVPPLATKASALTLLVNERHPLPGTLTGGAPVGEAAAPGFQALADAGIRTFIDLRADVEVAPEIGAAVEAAGLVYVRLPIGGEADLDLGSVRALDALLDDWSRYPIALVCSSGNRVGALLAVRAYWLDRSGAESALALGRAAGLTKLEPSVRLLLGLPPAGETAAATLVPQVPQGPAPTGSPGISVPPN